MKSVKSTASRLLHRRKGRKAQDAANAAVLLGIITAFIILYILFLPPDIRNDLLGESGSSIASGGSGSSGVGKLEATLLHENPGRLDFIAEDNYVHSIPSFYLSKTTNAQVLKEEPPITVRNGVFDKKNVVTTFRVQDLTTAQNVLLSFTATKRKGELTIKLNGREIFSSVVDEMNVPPITLDKSLLQPINELEFSVGSVGWQFWRTNEFLIQNLKITSDITDLTRQQANNVFSMSSIERYNLEKAFLKFIPDCRDAGTLHASINNIELYGGVPECSVLNVVEIPGNALEAGENNVVFKTDSGSYLIDRITVETTLRELPSIVYFFELSADQLEATQNHNLTANMTMQFVDDDKEKSAGVYVNGHATSLRQYGPTYVRSIPPEWLREGTNDLRIDPKSTLLLVTLDVELRRR